MSDARRAERLIAEVTADVLAADSIDDALEAITLGLYEPYALWRTSIWTFLPPDAARLDASWAIGDTEFDVGMIVRFSLTSDVEFLATSVMAGKPMMFRANERDLGLLTDMLRREGIASAVLQPIGRVRREPVGLLVLASSKSDVFRAQDVRLTTAIARAVGQKLSALIEQQDPTDG